MVGFALQAVFEGGSCSKNLVKDEISLSHKSLIALLTNQQGMTLFTHRSKGLQSCWFSHPARCRNAVPTFTATAGLNVGLWLHSYIKTIADLWDYGCNPTPKPSQICGCNPTPKPSQICPSNEPLSQNFGKIHLVSPIIQTR